MKTDLYDDDWINVNGNDIHKTAIVHPNVIMGEGNTIGAYCVIGGNGEMRDVRQCDYQGHVKIGNNNVISEFVSIQRPYAKGETTFIGHNNIIMAHAHIGHNAYIFDNTEICTSSVIGGYVCIFSNAKIKLSCTIRNRVSIGHGAVVGMGSVVVRNVAPDAIVMGNPAKEHKKNT